MKKTISLLAILIALPLAAQTRRAASHSFASDFQTIPVMSNVTGVGGARFISYLAILNPTSTAYPVAVTLYDSTGSKREATINLAAGELRTYTNFLADVFNYIGGGAVVFRSPDPSKRFVLSTEVVSNRYSTAIPVFEFAATSSRSFAAGINVDSTSRTNIGCVNQSDVANKVTATVYDASGKLALGTIELNLAANAWSQTAVTQVVSGGYVQFDPQEPALCYAVVVDNSTNDGRMITAAEYKP